MVNEMKPGRFITLRGLLLLPLLPALAVAFTVYFVVAMLAAWCEDSLDEMLERFRR